MSKILLYTDNHFCSYSSILRKRSNEYTVRLENQLQTLNWLTDTAKEYNCSFMMCLGDFFDKPDLTAMELAALSEVNFQGVSQHFIVGNHELGSVDAKYSSTHSFLINNEFEVYSDPAVIKLDNTMFFILPYQTHIAEFDTETKLNSVTDYFPPKCLDTDCKKVLLMHNDIKGIQMGMWKSQDGLDLNDLSDNFDLVVNGHIHNQMWVADNVLNLGNITGQNFSEDGFKYPHQAMIYDCETGEYELLNNPVALYFYKIDWSKKYDIDIINNISSKLKNAVVSIKVNSEDSTYVRYRFDPDYNPEDLVNSSVPKNCNVVAARISMEREKGSVQSVEEISSLQLDHIKSFYDYVVNNMETDKLTMSELEAILK